MAHQGTRRSIGSLAQGVVPLIPDKLYFRIGEVAELCGVPTYVLRFWESEFPQLKPAKGGTGQRLYRRKDVETVLHIRELLYEGKFTIPGARQALRTEQEQGQSTPPQLSLDIAEPPPSQGPEGGATSASSAIDRRSLEVLQQQLLELRALLGAPAAEGAKRSATQPIRSADAAEDSPQCEDLFP